jgi:small subunit ribosomal protein S17
MNSVWGQAPIWINRTPLLKHGREILGVVVKSGKSDKTVTVKCRWQVWNRKYGVYYRRTGKYLVHDEENFTRAGDIVVIKMCRKVSERKAFYIRNVVKQAGRYDYWENMIKHREQEIKKLMDENLEQLKKESVDEMKRAKGSQDKADLIRKLKVKAMSQAFERLREKHVQNRKSTFGEEI